MTHFHFSPRPNRAHEIAWRSWSTETFAEAQAADKPILLSLSAVWCHWCHVMDETSYSDSDVIATINKAFIPIRVDADQRPDINARYNAGGWPTTAFLTPDGSILNAQTYLPPEGIRTIIDVILEAYHKRRDEITEALARRHKHLLVVKPPSTDPLDPSILSVTRTAIEDAFDEEHGGFGQEPKFPQTDVLEFVTLEFKRTKDTRMERILSKTLHAMSHGGSYDHIEGGFFRYSTTRDWSIPHFEKMAEDHAGLIRAYALAWRALGTNALRETLLSALSYVRSVLRDHSSGLFAGSQDADEAYYASSLQERRAMQAPYIDRTSYTNWSASLAGAFAIAGGVLSDDCLTTESLQTLDTIATSLLDDQGLCYHFQIPGQQPRLSRQLTDQTAYLRALLDAYEVTGESRLLTRALALAEKIDTIFTEEDGSLVDHANDAQGLLSIRITPLPENASFADSLLRLSVITLQARYRERAHALLGVFTNRYASYQTFAAPYASAVARYLHGGTGVTILGTSQASAPLREAARRLPEPFLVTATFSENDPLIGQRGLRAMLGTPVAYICRGTACGAPVTEPAGIRMAFDALACAVTH
jgi:uncharacterized protein